MLAAIIYFRDMLPKPFRHLAVVPVVRSQPCGHVGADELLREDGQVFASKLSERIDDRRERFAFAVSPHNVRQCGIAEFADYGFAKNETAAN